MKLKTPIFHIVKLCSVLFFVLALPFSGFAQPANNNCASAISLTADAACVNGTTNGGTIQAGEPTACFTGGAGCNVEQTTWYSFNSGSNTSMWLEVGQTNSPNCAGGYAVYGPFATATGGCMPSAFNQVACENSLPASGGTLLTGLTTNSFYLVQVMGRNGGGGGDRFLDYCIAVESPDDCATCANPCGAACGFPAPPATVADVTCCCPVNNLSPHLTSGETGTYCNTLVASNDTIDFQIIISGTGCTFGNISALTWEVYNSGTCTGPVATGAFPALTATGLTVNNSYTWCYTMTAACNHSAHYPYFIGASSPLPLEMLDFSGQENADGIDLSWVADVSDLDRFEVERSVDGTNFESIGSVDPHVTGSDKNLVSKDFWFLNSANPTAEKTDGIREYRFSDLGPAYGTNFYRIQMIDMDGETGYSSVLKMSVETEGFSLSEVYPSPSRESAWVKVSTNQTRELQVDIISPDGKLLRSEQHELALGKQTLSLPVKDLAPGIYFARFRADGQNFLKKLVIF